MQIAASNEARAGPTPVIKHTCSPHALNEVLAGHVRSRRPVIASVQCHLHLGYFRGEVGCWSSVLEQSLATLPSTRETIIIHHYRPHLAASFNKCIIQEVKFNTFSHHLTETNLSASNPASFVQILAKIKTQ